MLSAFNADAETKEITLLSGFGVAVNSKINAGSNSLKALRDKSEVAL